MGNALALLHGVELHGGHDLDHAYRRCALDGTALRSSVLPLPRIAQVIGGIVTNARNAELAKSLPVSCIVTGTERISNAPMSVWFRGSPKSLQFAARHIFGSGDFDRSAPGIRHPRDCDVLVTDHGLLEALTPRVRPAIRVLPWLRQRAEVRASWSETLDGLPASLRKELRRYLSKRGYRARIDSGTATKLEFYEQCYLPYVKRRFGAAAILPQRGSHHRELKSSVLLELRAKEAFLGGSLLRHEAGVLFVGRTAFSPSHSVPSEVLDYFCLVLAQRLGCRWLDLGLARPHLEDGVFAYKTKWRPRLLAPGALKGAIRIRPLRASAATLGFLSRNGFIERRAGQYIVRRLNTAGEPSQGVVDDLSSLATRAGLDEMIVAFPGNGAQTARPRERVRACKLMPDDPLDAFVRST